jgi:ATP-dependent DNA helicase RecG
MLMFENAFKSRAFKRSENVVCNMLYMSEMRVNTHFGNETDFVTKTAFERPRCSAVYAPMKLHFGREIVQALAPDELQAIATAHIEGAVANGRLQELLDQHPADITRILKQLCTKGLLESDNRRRWATYRLAGKPAELPLLFPGLASADGERGESSPPHKEHVATDLLDEDTRAKLHVLAKPVAAAKRASKTAMENAILAICQDQYIRPQLLASLLNREPAALKYRFLAPLIKRGLLERKYPENPSHPDQAYRTSSRNARRV